VTGEFRLAGKVLVLADGRNPDEISAEAVAAQCGSEDLTVLFLGRSSVLAGTLAKSPNEVVIQIANNELSHDDPFDQTISTIAREEQAQSPRPI
jgi:hypothetical protein